MTTLIANCLFNTMPFTTRMEISPDSSTAELVSSGMVMLGKGANHDSMSVSFYRCARYGSTEITPEVNWSGCGSQSTVTAAYYANAILLASQIVADPTGFLLGIVTGANQNVTDCQWYHGDAKSVLAALVAVLS